MILEKVERWSRPSGYYIKTKKGRVIARFDTLDDVRRYLLPAKVGTKPKI
jgi:hypothetical protein